MTRAFIALAFIGALLCCTPAPAQSMTWYVGGEEPDFATIQQALDAAFPGDTVVVAQGIYVENIHFGGEDIVLRSTLPLNPDVVANTVIDGGGVGAVVTFNGSESEACRISGFTIQNGKLPYGGGICGGTPLNHTSATIENNIIWENWGDSGYFDGGGGGIAFCDGVIQNNLIAYNFGFWYGGGLYDCDGRIQNNTVVHNSTGDWGDGGGFYGCCDMTGVIQNCIVWGNAQLVEPMSNSGTPTYSCIEGWFPGDPTNIGSDPLFVNEMGGDFRLSDGSPCIDVGNPDPSGLPLADLDGNPRIINGIADMGAFEFQVPVGDIEVSPTEFDFGEVEIGASSGAVVVISNFGEADIELAGVSVVGSEDFSVVSCPALPVVIAPAGDPVQIEIAYEPLSVGTVSATVRIVSDDPDEGTVEVSLTGTGIATDLSPEEQIENILVSLSEFVEEGLLKGEGPGKSAAGRTKAFGNMLREAQDLILNGDFAAAYQQLLDAYRRVDGLPKPPDFVSGEAAAELAGMILELIDALAEG